MQTSVGTTVVCTTKKIQTKIQDETQE